MQRKSTGPMRAQLIRDSAQWGPHVKNLCEDIDVLVEQLRREKDSRTYYQGIVYQVCNVLDQISGNEEKIVCGTLEMPTTEVVDAMQQVKAKIDGLKTELKAVQHNIT